MNKNEPHMQALLLCESVSTDENGRHNILNEFSQYTMGYSQPFTIFSVWRGNCGEELYTEKSEIIAPDGRIVASGEHGPFLLKDETYRQVNSLLLENIDFTHEGLYEVQVSLLDDTNQVISEQSTSITVI
jgi:hypothetical protein